MSGAGTPAPVHSNIDNNAASEAGLGWAGLGGAGQRFLVPHFLCWEWTEVGRGEGLQLSPLYWYSDEVGRLRGGTAPWSPAHSPDTSSAGQTARSGAGPTQHTKQPPPAREVSQVSNAVAVLRRTQWKCWHNYSA